MTGERQGPAELGGLTVDRCRNARRIDGDHLSVEGPRGDLRPPAEQPQHPPQDPGPDHSGTGRHSQHIHPQHSAGQAGAQRPFGCDCREVSVVGHQHGQSLARQDDPRRLRRGEGHRLTRTEHGSAQVPPGDAQPAVSILRVLQRRRIEAQGHVVHEDPPVDRADIHSVLLAGIQRGQHPGRVGDVGAAVSGEVVAGAARHHDQWNAGLDRYCRHRADRPVATRSGQHVGAVPHRPARGGSVDGRGQVPDGHTSRQGGGHHGPLLPPTSGAVIHDQRRSRSHPTGPCCLLRSALQARASSATSRLANPSTTSSFMPLPRPLCRVYPRHLADSG
jgi:hypothetical protein